MHARAVRILGLTVVMIGGALLTRPRVANASQQFCVGDGVWECPADGEAWCRLGSGPTCHYVSCVPWGGGGFYPYFVECAPE